MITSIKKSFSVSQLSLFKPRNLFEMMEKPFNREAFVAGTKLARTQRQQRVGHIEPLFNFNLPTIIICQKHPIGFIQ